MAQHTPGPWTATRHAHAWQIDAAQDAVATTQFCYAPETEANARLIAAAPELYETLKDAKATLETAAKLLVERYPSVANNIVNQCAIRCGDILAKVEDR